MINLSNNNKFHMHPMVALAGTASVIAVVSYYRRYRRCQGSKTCNDDAPSSSSSLSSSPASIIPSQLFNSPYIKELQLAVRLAHQAGINMEGYLLARGTAQEAEFDLIVETKSNPADLSTHIDMENERLVIEGIRSAFPTHDIIGEETVGTGTIPRLDKDVPTWIIDPIDGTTNFSQGLFLTCVSIGYCVSGMPVMGVVYAPATQEWYMAIAGHGAYRNGIPIRRRYSQTSLERAVVGCEFGYSRSQSEIEAMLGAVQRILQHGCRAIRQLGSGVLDLCYVATGRLDLVYAGVVNEGWKPWDYAAGLVICQEAGCVMETIHQAPGAPFDLYGKSILCGVSREIVDELRQLLVSGK